MTLLLLSDGERRTLQFIAPRFVVLAASFDLVIDGSAHVLARLVFLAPSYLDNTVSAETSATSTLNWTSSSCPLSGYAFLVLFELSSKLHNVLLLHAAEASVVVHVVSVHVLHVVHCCTRACLSHPSTH